MSQSLSLVSWNVNSIKARGDHVVRFIKEHNPDILMLQELKGVDFPAQQFTDIGYQSEAVTQKSYNGVAIIARHDIDVIHAALPGDDTDEQARYLECDIAGLRVINIYLPNGNPVDTEKFPYKLAWMDRLIARVKTLRAQGIPFVIGGDFNIIPADADCHDPKAWAGDALFRPESLKRFRTLKNLGLNDAFRIYDDEAERYSFWDYQRGAWQRNNGIRIDHFLTSPQITDRLMGCEIDKEPRGWDRPSDHTPIVLRVKSL